MGPSHAAVARAVVAARGTTARGAAGRGTRAGTGTTPDPAAGTGTTPDPAAGTAKPDPAAATEKPDLAAGIATARSAAAVLSAATVLSVAACGGARPSFDGTVYRAAPIAFQLPVLPASWRRVDISGGSLAFRDDAQAASVLVNARCSRHEEGTPLVALTNHLLIGSTQREVSEQATEPFDGREALHTRVRAKWDGVPLALSIFVLKKDGCVYDLVYSSPPERFLEGVETFERFARGFRTLPGSGVVGAGGGGPVGS